MCVASHILFIDDADIEAELLRIKIARKKLDVKVDHVTNQQAALNAIKQHRDYDLILVDIVRPDVDLESLNGQVRNLLEHVRKFQKKAAQIKLVTADIRESALHAYATTYKMAPITHLLDIQEVS